MTSREISAFLQERIGANDFPSAVYVVAEKGDVVFRDALGFAVVEPERIPATLDTVYDLASLTKPLVTGLLAAQQIEDGDIALESRLKDEHIVFGETPVSALTVKQLATHTSGLPAWLPFYMLTSEPTPRELGRVIGEQPLGHSGDKVEYSDLNFIALSLIIENGRPDGEFELGVCRDLNLKRTSFNPLARGFDQREIAASEKGNEYEKQTCVELGYLRPDWTASIPACTDAERPKAAALRDYQIWGEVHDGNAWFMGGVAGHAGLFSTADETFRIAQQFLPNYTTLLKPETCELFRTNFTPGMNEHRSFAFQLASTPESTAGTRMSPEAFGHLGFTGTSLWIDPVKERVFILLTNRTHAHPLPLTNINSVRRRFHDLANDLLDKLSN